MPLKWPRLATQRRALDGVVGLADGIKLGPQSQRRL